MTSTTATLAVPARLMAENARQTAHLRSNRATVQSWLTQLNLDTIEELFDAVSFDNTAATALLVTDHQRGTTLATTVLLGAKAFMLSRVSYHAPGETLEERFQVTVDAFLDRGLARVNADHRYLDQQLYWRTLRTVTKAPSHTQISSVEVELFSVDIAGPDVYVDVESHLTVGIVLDWAQDKGLLNDVDRRALELRYTGQSVLAVREVAARIGVGENGLETRLRRAMKRMQAGIDEHGDELRQACVAALWSGSRDAVAAAAVADGVAA